MYRDILIALDKKLNDEIFESFIVNTFAITDYF